ncbi:MAG: acyl-CoA dehydrogenase family protein, partial [Burkholderiales bacterium]|nr:acyl-CoA dehydrogenase family protein [Burkholderiales bacterium]
MSDRTYLDWPFFEPQHRALEEALDAWAGQALDAVAPHGDVDAACRRLVAALGEGGWLRYCVPAAHGGALPALESRSLCLIRETLARRDGLADFAFAMQGLGSGAITLAGSDALRQRYLPRVARGAAIAAFALSEPDAGSDVAAMSTSARAAGDGIVLDGT